MQLQVIGPERDHRCEGGARAHEGEVGARQLERGASSLPRRPATLMRSRRSAVGQRFPARAPSLTAMSDAGAAEDGSDERGRGGLAGGARDADARAPPALEQQVAEAREARTASTELHDPRRDLGRPDVEVRDLGLTGVGIEVDAGLDVDPELTQLPRLGGLGLRAREPHRVALAGEQSRERHCVGVEPLDQDIHTWIIAGRRRSPARRRASRRVARARRRAAADGRTASQARWRRGAERAARSRGSCSTPSPPLARRSRAARRFCRV